MINKHTCTLLQRLTLIVLLVFLLGAFSLSAALAQDATDILIWSLGYASDYNDVLVERFNEEHDDVNIVYEDVLTGDITENSQKVRIAMENEGGSRCARRRRCRR